MDEITIVLLVVSGFLIWFLGGLIYALATNDPVPYNEWIPMPREFPGMPSTWPAWVALVAATKMIDRSRRASRLTIKLVAATRRAIRRAK